MFCVSRVIPPLQPPPTTACWRRAPISAWSQRPPTNGLWSLFATAGLAWITILRKREAFRAAFAQFDPEIVAQFGEADVERLLGDAGIVRHRGKIEATIANAQATLALREAGTPLDEVIWSFAPDGDRPAPRSWSDVPAQTDASRALSKELRRHGFRFVGPTTAYAAMQACGLVNDHLAGCPARRA